MGGGRRNVEGKEFLKAVNRFKGLTCKSPKSLHESSGVELSRCGGAP